MSTTSSRAENILRPPRLCADDDDDDDCVDVKCYEEQNSGLKQPFVLSAKSTSLFFTCCFNNFKQMPSLLYFFLVTTYIAGPVQ